MMTNCSIKYLFSFEFFDKYHRRLVKRIINKLIEMSNNYRDCKYNHKSTGKRQLKFNILRKSMHDQNF